MVNTISIQLLDVSALKGPIKTWTKEAYNIRIGTILFPKIPNLHNKYVIRAHPLVDPHGGPDLLGGDGHPLILKQLLESEDRGEHPSVTHGAGPVKNTRLWRLRRLSVIHDQKIKFTFTPPR